MVDDGTWFSARPFLLADGLFAYLKMETQLKLADLTSGNPRWVRPVPTRFDEFVLGLPVGALLIIGVVLLSSVRWKAVPEILKRVYGKPSYKNDRYSFSWRSFCRLFFSTSNLRLYGSGGRYD